VRGKLSFEKRISDHPQDKVGSSTGAKAFCELSREILWAGQYLFAYSYIPFLIACTPTLLVALTPAFHITIFVSVPASLSYFVDFLIFEFYAVALCSSLFSRRHPAPTELRLTRNLWGAGRTAGCEGLSLFPIVQL